MPPAARRPQPGAGPPPPPCCPHGPLQVRPSPHARAAGFSAPSAGRKLAAATASGRNPLLLPPPTSATTKDRDRGKGRESQSRRQEAADRLAEEVVARDAGTWPAPLVLPGDDLAADPGYPAQSLRAWARLPERNRPGCSGTGAGAGREASSSSGGRRRGCRRDTIYIASSPRITSGVAFMEGWGKPAVTAGGKGKGKGKGKGGEGAAAAPPGSAAAAAVVDRCVEYVRAFYHGMPVKRLPVQLEYVPWDGDEEEEEGEELAKPKRRGKGKAQTAAAAAETRYIGLAASSGGGGGGGASGGGGGGPPPPSWCTRIRTRAPLDDALGGRQLNLDDVLDAALGFGGGGDGDDDSEEMPPLLPADAFALAVVVDQDLYEDEEDVFCCGRAYGGSRVAVVSAARYNPAADDEEDYGYGEGEGMGDGDGAGMMGHASWPASHCAAYVRRKVRAYDDDDDDDDDDDGGESEGEEDHNSGDDDDDGDGAGLAGDVADASSSSPLRAAVEAYAEASREQQRRRRSRPGDGAAAAQAQARALWDSRVARTVAHELGHCLGMDHCVYYACAMQGSAGLGEDARQPPYLCPVCEAKVAYAVERELWGGGEEKKKKKNEEEEKTSYAIQRYEAIAEVCARWSADSALFAAYGAWVGKRLEQLGREGEAGGVLVV